MKSKIIEFLTVALFSICIAVLLYIGIPWAMEEPIYCGNRPCSEVKK